MRALKKVYWSRAVLYHRPILEIKVDCESSNPSDKYSFTVTTEVSRHW